ncbi:MAG: PaaI family thioesterase [Rubrivivax sp.]
MSSDQIVERMNTRQPAVIQSLKGRVLTFAPERKELRMEFDIGVEFCHTVDIVQGGFITAMLDAAMAHVVMAVEPANVRVSSIDINVSFLRPARAGRFTAVGAIVKTGRTVGFLRAELFTDQGELVATATSSAYLTREHK